MRPNLSFTFVITSENRMADVKILNLADDAKTSENRAKISKLHSPGNLMFICFEVSVNEFNFAVFYLPSFGFNSSNAFLEK